MDLSIPVNPGETELSALESAVDRRQKRDASAWEEAVDWGVAEEYGALRPSEWRMATAPDFD